jgi:hypothetical protein
MTSGTTAALAERISFFFSDSNFRTDQFMQKESAANDGYIEISSLIKFNSIKKISVDIAAIAEAAKTIDEVVVSKDGEAIRRRDPLPENNDANERTLFVKDLPMEEDATEAAAAAESAAPAATESAAPAATEVAAAAAPVAEKSGEEAAETPAETSSKAPAAPKAKKPFVPKRFTCDVAAVSALFASYGEIALVRFRFSKTDLAKGLKKSALGGAFVEFKTKEGCEAAKAAIAEEGKKWLVNDKEVIVSTMADFLSANKKGGKGPNAGKKDAGGKKEEKKEEAKIEIVPIEWEKNTVISFTAVPEGCDREMIQDAFESVEGVDAKADLYIDYSRGESDGSVRFKTVNAEIANIAKKFVDGELTIGGTKVGGATVLEGEEEEKYWTLAAEQMAERKAKAQKRDRPSGGYNNKGGNNKRRKN